MQLSNYSNEVHLRTECLCLESHRLYKQDRSGMKRKWQTIAALPILSLICEYINEGIQDALSFHYLDDKAVLIRDTLGGRLGLRVLIVVVYHSGFKPSEGVPAMCIGPS